MDHFLDHPMASELAEFVDGTLDPDEATRIRDHLSGCLVCHVATARDLGPFDADVAASISTLPSAVDRPQVAPWLVEPMRAGRRPEPAAGQLWQVADGPDSGLAVVLRMQGSRPLVLPAALEVEMADEATVIVPSTATPLDVPLAVWIRLATLIEQDRLAFHIADLPVVSDLELAYSDFTHGRPISEALWTGFPISDPVDTRWRYRESLREVFGRLSVIPADMAGSAGRAAATHINEIETVEDTTAGDLPSRLRRDLEILLPEAWIVPDSEAGPLISAALPLELSSVVQITDLRIRVAVDTVGALEDAADRVSALEAVNLVGLLRDCERLAIVIDDHDRTTYMLDSYDINVDLPESGERRHARLPDPEPFDLAFARLRDVYLSRSSFIHGVEIHRVAADLDLPAQRACQTAISKQASRPFEAAKKAAFQALDSASAIEDVAVFVAGSRQRSDDDYEAAFERLVDRMPA